MKLGMLGMWHTHADGIVRQVAEHPDEFSLVGFDDGGRRSGSRAATAMGAGKSPDFASLKSQNSFWPRISMAWWSKGGVRKSGPGAAVLKAADR